MDQLSARNLTSGSFDRTAPGVYEWVHWVGQYIEWSKKTFDRPLSPVIDNAEFKCFASFSPDTKYGRIALKGLYDAEMSYCEDLPTELKDTLVPGAIVEFGVYRGDWINRLYDLTETVDFKREIWGFDSFEGLSEPDPDADSGYWKKGAFAAELTEVQILIKASERPRIRLVPGWFSDSLGSKKTAELTQVAFARIDCDIYRPCLECLNFLSSRLSHGAVLVFDDWSHDLRIGEARAFAEWAETVPELRFEFLFYSGWDHFYIRVWHRDQQAQD